MLHTIAPATQNQQTHTSSPRLRTAWLGLALVALLAAPAALAQDTVWASIPVFGRNFQASHLMLAVQVMTGLADELDDRLHGEFGGKRFFGEGDKPSTPQTPDGDHRPGMYL